MVRRTNQRCNSIKQNPDFSSSRFLKTGFPFPVKHCNCTPTFQTPRKFKPISFSPGGSKNRDSTVCSRLGLTNTNCRHNCGIIQLPCPFNIHVFPLYYYKKRKQSFIDQACLEFLINSSVTLLVMLMFLQLNTKASTCWSLFYKLYSTIQK